MGGRLQDRLMDRDKALIHAAQIASGSRTIVIVYQAVSGDWYCVDYNTIAYELQDYRQGTTRYVLPNGEVTKLS